MAMVLGGMIHEAGHGILVLLFGGNINSIQPFFFNGAPQISYTGDFTSGARALIAMGGVGASLFVAILGIKLIPFDKFNPPLKAALSLMIISFLSQSLAWIFIPILYMLGIVIGDDSVNFIHYSRWHPLIVAGLSIIILLVVLKLFFQKTNFINTLRELKTYQLQEVTSGSKNKVVVKRYYTLGLWVAIVLCLAVFTMVDFTKF